jgi:hypothetical protein
MLFTPAPEPEYRQQTEDVPDLNDPQRTYFATVALTIHTDLGVGSCCGNDYQRAPCPIAPFEFQNAGVAKLAQAFKETVCSLEALCSDPEFIHVTEITLPGVCYTIRSYGQSNP